MQQLLCSSKVVHKLFVHHLINKYILILTGFRIKQKWKKMLSGDNYMKFCGVWEKSISLMMNIALFLTSFLSFCLPLIPLFIIFQQGPGRVNGIKTCTSHSPVNYEDYECMFQTKVIIIWSWITTFFCGIHLVGIFAHPFTIIVYCKSKVSHLKNDMKGLLINWSRFNLILILILVGIQACVSYKFDTV